MNTNDYRPFRAVIYGLPFLFSLFFALSFPLSATAEEVEEAEVTEAEDTKTIADLTEDAERFEGLFTLFRANKTGESHMLIDPSQLDREYIYWMHTAEGIPEAGSFRGMYGDGEIIEFQRHFNTIEVVRKNTSFYFDPQNAISRASEANISDAVLAVLEIVAEDEESGQMLVGVDALFATDALVQIQPTPDPEADPTGAFTPGAIDDGKSRILNLRSYPENTDVEVRYVFHNPAPLASGGEEITDERNVSIRVMHSFIAVPENDYQPRLADPRMGHFTQQVTDLTSGELVNYRDLVERWHLVKKDPDAELSEPVEPITWWIENTTPEAWRELIRGAALEWNKPFEKIGFKNAVVVKVQPDDADWDAGDIRYNVLRWTSSPTLSFGGYGPHFVNPRTGQILGADIMLEFAPIFGPPRLRKLIQDPAALSHDNHLALLHNAMHERYCNVAEGLAMNTSFARAAIDSVYADDDGELEAQLTRDNMHFLIIHEIGHTLGMNHNMKASQLLSDAEVFDREVVAEKGLTASIMDYPAVNFAPDRDQQTLFYPITPGSYDDWYIEYTYSEGLDDPAQEAVRLETILSRSTDPALAFGNDADDMRSPGTGIDPRVNIFDMSSDAVAYADGYMDLMRRTLGRLATRVPEEGESWQQTLSGITSTMNLWRSSGSVVSRYIGGVYVDRAMAGQEGATDPFRPVEAERQRQAMEVLSRQVFAPDAFALDPMLLRHAAPQRRGFDHMATTEDPKIHDAVLQVQKTAFDHLLHPVVMKRITDTALYGNEYSLAEVMGDLTDAVFAADAEGDVNSFRQGLQHEYVQRLTTMLSPEGAAGYHPAAVSLALYNLNEIQELIDEGEDADVATQAHRAHLSLIIERALDT